MSLVGGIGNSSTSSSSGGNTNGNLGGQSWYSNVSFDFNVVVLSPGSSKMLNLSGINFFPSIQNIANGSLTVTDSDGNTYNVDVTNDVDAITSTTYRFNSFFRNFENTDEIVWTFPGPLKTLDLDIGSDSVTVQNPDYQNYTASENFISESDLAAGTDYYDIDFQGYKHATFQTACTTDNAADTIAITAWATLDPDASDSADTGWVDISQNIFSAASIGCTGAAGSQSGIYFLDTAIFANKLRFKVVTTSSTGNCAVDCFVKKGY